MLYCDKHEMEKEIYRNMKKRGRIRKSHGKWVISYPALYCAIKETVYFSDYDTIIKIIDNMINGKYIRISRSWRDNYIILKWVN